MPGKSDQLHKRYTFKFKVNKFYTYVDALLLSEVSMCSSKKMESGKYLILLSMNPKCQQMLNGPKIEINIVSIHSIETMSLFLHHSTVKILLLHLSCSLHELLLLHSLHLHGFHLTVEHKDIF